MRRRLPVVLLSVFLGTLGFIATAQAQYVGIFMDPQATSCAEAVGVQPWIDLHVVAVLEGDRTEIHGLQFQVTGMPPGWGPQNVLWVPDVDLGLTLGNPMWPGTYYEDSGGVNIALPACTGPGPSNVHLGRLVILGAQTPDDVVLRVEPVQLVPTDPDCIIVNDCIAPVYGKQCIEGGQIILNGTGSSQAGCVVAVEEATWTTVRQLYR